jgi:hypothetical protein
MTRHGQLGRCIGAAVAAIVVLGFAAQVRAHFLFIRIGTQAEAGRSAEVYFSEQAEAGDPRFIAKVADTKLWVQTRPGEFHELQVRAGSDRLRAVLPADRSLAVVGRCEYGVLARPKQTAFLLRYYPKAVAGAALELDRLTPKGEIPFEIQPSFAEAGHDQPVGNASAGSIRLAALRHGKPIAGAVFTAVDSDLSESTIKADSNGRAVWTPPAPGRYSIYVRETLKQAGEHNGKKYDEIREFATLAFTWPLEGRDADPEALDLFKQAIAQRAEWRDFPGFSANVSGQIDGRPFTGTVAVQRDGSLDIRTDDVVAKPWLKDQLDSLVMHRLPPPSSDSSGSQEPRYRFADQDEDNPVGRLIAVEGGAMASSYRIKDRQITVVNRRMGKQNMTITILDNDRNTDGRFLPHSYVVHYWDTASGKLNSIETVQDRWHRVESWDLPASHFVSTASDAGFSAKVVEFSDFKLRPAK